MFDQVRQDIHPETHKQIVADLRVRKGAFLDASLQRKIRCNYPGENGESLMLSAAAELLHAIRSNPSSLLSEAVLRRGAVVNPAPLKEALRYKLCLLEVARSTVGTRVGIEADYRVIKGREYCGPPQKEMVSTEERPYVEGIMTLAALYRKYFV